VQREDYRAGDRGQIMESKSRRASRLAAPAGESSEPAEAVEIRAPSADLSEAAIEAVQSDEMKIEQSELTEAVKTAAELAAGAQIAQEGGGTSEQAHLAPAKPAGAFERNTLSAWAQSQAALARGLEVVSAEMAGLALGGMDATAAAASKLLRAKTFSDAIAVNAGFACNSLNALLGGFARLSEVGVKLAAENSELLLSQFGEGWRKAARPRP
jgi:Phasin protein